jgi:hypothetical protein
MKRTTIIFVQIKLMDVSASASSLHGSFDQQVNEKQHVLRVDIPTTNITSSGDGSYFSLNNSEKNMYSEFDLLSSQLSHQPLLFATPVPVQSGNKKQIENASSQLVSNSSFY